jgi:hypothetical protein
MSDIIACLPARKSCRCKDQKSRQSPITNHSLGHQISPRANRATKIHSPITYQATHHHTGTPSTTKDFVILRRIQGIMMCSPRGVFLLLLREYSTHKMNPRVSYCFCARSFNAST